MPYKGFPEIKTIEHLIFYQYAKIIAKGAFGKKMSPVLSPKEMRSLLSKTAGFIRGRLRKLISGEIEWSSILREDLQFAEIEKACVYCGAASDIQKDHIVPKSVKICPECSDCERIMGIHNIIWACKECNKEKSDKGLYTFWRDKNPDNPAFYNVLPVLVEKKYLKTIWYCYRCAGTLQAEPEGLMRILDIDGVIDEYTQRSTIAGRVRPRPAEVGMAAGNEAKRSDRIAVENRSEELSGHSAGAPFPAVMAREKPLAGKTVAVTGKLERYSRGEMERLIKELGGKPVSSVSKKTDFVVVGRSAGKKLADAQKLGVAVMTEEEFAAEFLGK